MCGSKATIKKSSLARLPLHAFVAAALASPLATPAMAQMEGVLEEITVTAQRREERLEDVPISVSTMDGERLASILEGGEVATRIERTVEAHCQTVRIAKEVLDGAAAGRGPGAIG